jgi:HSP20 family molecular chaperone IbpA
LSGAETTSGAPADEEVSEDTSAIRICIDMPGVHFKDLKVHLRRNGVLEVRAIRRRLGLDGTTVVKKTKISRRYAIDSRTVDVNKIGADLALGVLVITAPKKLAREMGTTTPPPQAQATAPAAGYETPPERQWASMIAGSDAAGAAAAAAGSAPTTSPFESSSTEGSKVVNPRSVSSPSSPRRSSLVLEPTEPSSPGIMNRRRASATGVKTDRKVTIVESSGTTDASVAAARIAAMASIEAAAASAEAASASSTSSQDEERAVGTTNAVTAEAVELLTAVEPSAAALKTSIISDATAVAVDAATTTVNADGIIPQSSFPGSPASGDDSGAGLTLVSLHRGDRAIGGVSGEAGGGEEARPGSAASFVAEESVANDNEEVGDAGSNAAPVGVAAVESAANGGGNDGGGNADAADLASSSTRRVSVTP